MECGTPLSSCLQVCNRVIRARSSNSQSPNLGGAVGLGDITPKTVQGRLLTVGWMFISIAMLSMLYASVTTNFSNLSLAPSRVLDIPDPSSLAPYRVGTAVEHAEAALRELIPDPQFSVRTFAPNARGALFAALVNGSLDVVVERPEMIQYYNNLVAGFQGMLQPAGPVFFPEAVAFAVRRLSPEQELPLLRLLSSSVAEATRSDRLTADSDFDAWFGAGRASACGKGNAPLDVELDTVNEIKNQALWTLLAFLFTWLLISFYTTMQKYPQFLATNHTCEIIRFLLKIPDQVNCVVI